MADDDRADNPWAKIETPLAGKARSIGGYSAGCVIGAVELPQSGVGFQVVRPKRKRNFGHPELIAVIQDIAAALDAKGKGPLLIADLGQPAGGPAPSGRALFWPPGMRG